MPYIRANGAKIAFHTYGDMDKPALILIHGAASGGNGRFFWDYENFAQTLAKDYFVVAYDRRCSGQTGFQPPCDIDTHAKDVIALADALCLDRPAAAGLSAGTYVLGRALCLDQEKFSKAILIVPNSHAEGLTPAAAYVKRCGFDITTIDPKMMMELGDRASYAPTTPASLKQKVQEYNDRTTTPISAEGTAAGYAGLATFDNRPGLAYVKTPTLIISAEHDGFCPPEEGETIHKLMENSRFVVFKDAAHMVMMEKYPEVMASVQQFLAE